MAMNDIRLKRVSRAGIIPIPAWEAPMEGIMATQNAICPTCGIAHTMPEDHIAISERWFGLAKMECKVCLSIPVQFRDKLIKIRVKYMEGKDLTATERKFLHDRQEWKSYVTGALNNAKGV